MVNPTYLDVTIGPRMSFSYPTNPEDTFFVYVFEGRLAVRDDRSESWIGEGEIALLTHDTKFNCNGGKEGGRFLLIGGKSLHESISWSGPVVMNTEEELEIAFKELREGTFIKSQ
jgi:quercetin 2,3-dioxygenase